MLCNCVECQKNIIYWLQYNMINNNYIYIFIYVKIKNHQSPIAQSLYKNYLNENFRFHLELRFIECEEYI